MMHISEQFGYYQGDGFTMVELPYTGSQVSMILVVPDQGKFSQFEQGLSAGQWDAAVKGLKHTQVNLALPKFTFTSQFSLKDALEPQRDAGRLPTRPGRFFRHGRQ